MGAEPYWYFVKYQPDIETALQELREREFKAGRYHPVTRFLEFPVTADSPAPGTKHKSIEQALAAASADGTRSILDIQSVSDEPDVGVATPLDDEVIESLYGTPAPTHEMVEDNLEFLEEIDRGQAVYFLIYKGSKPAEILFAGYSFD